MGDYTGDERANTEAVPMAQQHNLFTKKTNSCSMGLFRLEIYTIFLLKLHINNKLFTEKKGGIMKVRQFTVVCLASISFTGCATITSDKMQTISVNTKATDGQAVEKVSCTLKNDKGMWQMESPGFVIVHRSAEDLLVECKKDGVSDGFLRAISRAAGGMWGNILIGGGVGAIIDHTNGSGYNYPDELPVKMGTSTTVDRSQSTPQQPATSAVNQEMNTAQKN